eukprot:Skav208298  [mRNA]  locus=scaffold897:192040:192750:+ [translate_table: standard]
MLCGLASAVPELPQLEKSGADAASTLNASNTNSSSGKSSWPHGGCCDGCNTAFCSPKSGTCYNHKGKYYYYQCTADVYPTASCCRYCSTEFCSPQSQKCYNYKEFSYLETCFSYGHATRPFGLRGSKILPKPKIEEAEDTNSSIKGAEESLARTAGYYPRNEGWNCWNPNTMHSSDGYIGRTSVSTCHAMCDRRSWCVGFVYMRCQNKCWLREEGTSCSHANKGEAACFDYYGFIN